MCRNVNAHLGQIAWVLPNPPEKRVSGNDWWPEMDPSQPERVRTQSGVWRPA